MQDFGGIAGGLPGSAGGLPGGILVGEPGPGMDRLLMAETLGLVMARRAAEILDRHRESLTPDGRPRSLEDTVLEDTVLEDTVLDGRGAEAAADRFALDDAIFTAVLDATNECLGRFDSRPPAERWCDALLHLLDLARYADEG
jgi:hypothetical protein